MGDWKNEVLAKITADNRFLNEEVTRQIKANNACMWINVILATALIISVVTR